MSESNNNFIQLRSRTIEKPNSETQNIYPRASSPIEKPRSQLVLENINKSIRESTQFYKELSNRVDKSIAAQNCSTLFSNLSDPAISYIMTNAPATVYNKDIAELMATNIPKFDLSPDTNPALELRSFIKSCENVLSLFDPDDDENIEEFFKLIKFRLGYNVQERLTIDKFENMQDLETHLRSVCHLKLNKGKLLSEIRHERQNHNEDVSHFVERLRKLIAQGRSEYTNDKEFEKEAIHTLKNSVRNELISIKLMDSKTNKFEELAEIAINRDSELNQRAYNTSKTENRENQELINKLMQKIKDLELKQSASIHHIRQEPRLKSIPMNKYNVPSRTPQRSNLICAYCKKSGHHINDCRKRNRNLQNNFSYTNNYDTTNKYKNVSHNLNHRNYQPTQNQDYRAKNQENMRPSENYYQNQYRPPNNYKFRNQSTEINPVQDNRIITCVRCNQPGHKSNNCFEIMCSNCRGIGHSNNQCIQNSTTRRVHFTNCEQCNHSPIPIIEEASYNPYKPDQGNE